MSTSEGASVDVAPVAPLKLSNTLLHPEEHVPFSIDEITPIVEKNIRAPEELARLIKRIQGLVCLAGRVLDAKDWTPEHLVCLTEFIEDSSAKKLVIYVEEKPAEKSYTLHVQTSLPTTKQLEILYFIRSNGDFITEENFEHKIQYGTINGETMESLLRMMQGVYMPMFLSNKKWPERVRKEFTSQAHKFMAFLTDTTFQMKGHTVLYVPDEDLASPERAAKSNDVVQRLESLLVHWTRQVKDVINNQNTSESNESSGPLEEIQFWRSRCEDLSSISQQLNRTDVQRIIHVLNLAKSSYLDQFLRLSNSIQEGTFQAQDNLRFLSALIDPCHALATADARSIPTLIPKLLNCVRIIWENSKFYNTKERMNNLLRKFSNEIINRCSAQISLEDVFHGDVQNSMVKLQESISCGEAWKDIFKSTTNHVSKRAKVPWDFDQSSIFAQIDAFVQRCRDLLEVCEGQVQFARKIAGGQKSPIPIFGGSKGPEIAKGLEDVEMAFEKNIAQLWNIRVYILDVKATRWHDDYNAFKQGVKDLEVMMQTIITSAFDSCPTIEGSVELLEIFQHLAKRDAIKRVVEKKTADVLQMFLNELSYIKNLFESNRKTPDIQRTHPEHAGSGYWAKSLHKRISHSFNIISNAYYLPETPLTAEVKAQYEPLVSSLEDYVMKIHAEWLTSIPPLDTKLDCPLMARKGDGLEMKFDKDLLKVFAELNNFQKLKNDIPFHLQEIYGKREELRTLRENVLLVVRDYNSILENLSREEQSLFRERIKFLDRKIGPGLTTLTWASKGISEYFVKECRKYAREVQVITENFIESNAQIRAFCKDIAGTLLWSVENKKIYDLSEFDSAQDAHRSFVRQRLTECYEHIQQILLSIFDVFKNDGKDIYTQWILYVEKIDLLIEDALRQSVRHSLFEASKAINGEGKNREGVTEVQPLFKVNVILDGQKVDFSPSLLTVDSTISKIALDMISTISVVPRLTEKVLVDYSKPIKKVFDIIATESEVQKILSGIQAGVSGNAIKTQAYLKNWDSFKEIYEINKDAFIRRYAKLKPALSTFDADINRYTEVSNNVQKEETLTPVGFLRLDCSPLKQSLVAHAHAWQSKLTTLLNSNVNSELNNLHEMFTKKSALLKTTPMNLDQLSDSMDLLAKLKESSPSIEAQFGPIHDQYEVLEKYEFNVREHEKQLLEKLPIAWAEFQATLQEVEKMLNECKSKFKSEILSSVDEFSKNNSLLREDFHTKGPFVASIGLERSLKIIDEYRSQLDTLLETERTLARGLAVFDIDQTPSKDLQSIKFDLDLLLQVWTIVSEWTTMYNAWKVKPFLLLPASDVEESVVKHLKKMNKIPKEAKEWEVYSFWLDKVQHTKRTVPLLQELKNNALRARHWTEMQEETGKTFDPLSPEFNIEKIMDLGLDQYYEIISTISVSASKELSIEEGISAIEEAWVAANLDIVPHKDAKSVFKLKSTDEIFELLEDNQVSLSSMKASKFSQAFMLVIEDWEAKLATVVDTIEIILLVQKQWMYLENIFIGAEDIRKQLPKESSMFDSVDGNWKVIMVQMNADKNAIRATHVPNVYDQLVKMNEELERIQKSLDMYLETKRQAFPRFYFLSNDDLLEILGRARDPASIQPHLKKCFDNLSKLDLVMAGSERNHNEALGMHSGDGESVPFDTPVVIEGPVENWLNDVESRMRTSLRKLLGGTIAAAKKMKRDKWLKEWPGQLLITSSLIEWTTECMKALQETEKGDKGALKSLKKNQGSSLKKLAEMVKLPLSKVERKKLIALITVEVHSRDCIDKMMKVECSSPVDFEWLSQLRFFWEKSGRDESEDCYLRQINTNFKYDYEYLGNSGRLVITPLTDRCYMTLTSALTLFRGGSPQGPAGTGKTETVKDLGKALGKYVIVQNCSESLDYKSIGRMFSGLAQTGAWGCFDEFNRIDIEVLSVVALQISSILTAVSRRLRVFLFEDKEIRLNVGCGIFITMNPGYAGRVELPDNLKALFRPVSMMVPDSALIAEIMLFAEGFSNTRALSKKVDTLYKLATQQLSKQDHYDYGLRALTSCLRSAGMRKRNDLESPDDAVLCVALRDNNIPKLTAGDLPLFMSILNDLFPGVEMTTPEYKDFRVALLEEMQLANLQPVESFIAKVIQLYETMMTRHGVMVVGETGAGKSTCWKLLQSTLANLNKKFPEKFNPARTFPINPKSLALMELYGEFNIATNEWTDGVLSSVMRTACSDDKKDLKWVVLDGPVDTQWIESMNTVLDDNKILTLINGERIALTEQVSLLFEVENLSAASPATVSRCGMIYVDYKNLSWRPYIQSWLKMRPESSVEVLRQLVEKFIPETMQFRRSCVEIVGVSEFGAIRSFTALFEAVCNKDNGVDPEDKESYPKMLELWFLFAIIWSLGGSLVEESRKKFDMFLREIEGQFPSKDTVYEYYVDKSSKSWQPWEDKLPNNWRYSASTPFYRIFVPTVDSIRNEFIVRSLIANRSPVIAVGDVGVGKTSLLQSVIFNPEVSTGSTLCINMSAQTSANSVQNMIESRLEKRTKNVYVPIGGKRMICFIDDFNLPVKDTFGSQPPLEFLRHLMEYGFAYDRQKQFIRHYNDITYLAAMGTPGGGRNHISPRNQSRFNILNITFPSEASLSRIFGSIINQKLQDFEEELKPLGDIFVASTIDIYSVILAKLLPTPSRTHYVFNLRDISKVFQGLLRSHKDYYDTRDVMVKLWVHEMSRVFSDRLVDNQDRELFDGLIEQNLITRFNTSLAQLSPNKAKPVFVDFLSENDAPAIYQEVTDYDALRALVEERLEDYCSEPGFVALDLVLFRDAISHVCRISRILKQPNGHAFLIGVGGSGKQSLTRLAAYLIGMSTFQVKIAKNYRLVDFREDLKRLYRLAGLDNKPTAFLFTDAQILHNNFLEDVSNILNSGEVPNLFAPDEIADIKQNLQGVKLDKAYEGGDPLFSFFLERVRSNLHVVLCMSPVGDIFRARLRMFPTLVNCTTIDWFSDWPEDALMEVSQKYLKQVDLGSDLLKNSISKSFVGVHLSVTKASRRMAEELKRYNYVTPINFLELVNGYRDLLKEKRKEVGDAAAKLRNGLNKLDDTRVNVEKMSVELEVAKKQVAQFQKQCEDYLVVIVQQKREADEQAKQVGAKAEKLAVEEAEVQTEADAAQADLDQALPAMQAAVKALEALNKKDLNEIRSYAKPPPLVEKVMEAVMVLKKAEPSWDEAKRQLGNPSFIKQLIGFDKDAISDKVLKRISQYCSDENFQPDIVGRVSGAAKSLCMWARAMETYGLIYRQVLPKKEKLRGAQEALEKKQRSMREAKAKLQEINDKLSDLKAQYDEKATLKEKLRQEAELTEIKLTRAEKLVSGLSGERSRWEISIKNYEESFGYLPGDCIIAAAFLSYAGAFNTQYREYLVRENWLAQIKLLEIPISPTFNFDFFIGKATEIRDWNIQGLPSDAFSSENGIIVTRGRRWPLMIDPQGQALNWVKNMESKRKLKILDLKQNEFLRTLENAIQHGIPVLVPGVSENIDPMLDPILNKAIIKKGGRWTIKLGEKEVDYNPEFKFYMTTKLANPKYSPEIFAKVAIVNFAVKEKGLEDQLLGTIIRKEKPDLEAQKNTLVSSVAAAKKKLIELEDEILYLLSTAQGSLLDNEKLVGTLQSSKTIAEDVTAQLVISEQTEVRIDAAREAYRPAAERASILFFVLNDMASVDPMYQFSLDFYVDLFEKSIARSKKFDDITERIASLNDYHTYSVYKSVCRGLFGEHKLLFSFQMTLKILFAQGKVNKEEYDLFLCGGQVLDKESQPKNPFSEWVSDATWDNITELDNLAPFNGLSSSIEQSEREWKTWFMNSEPEAIPLPGEWDNKLNDLQRMLVVRSFRVDRVMYCAHTFVINNLSPRYVEPPLLDMAEVLAGSSAKTPLIFVLSPGVDPLTSLQGLAEKTGMMSKFSYLSLGQGQSPKATKLIQEGATHGNWVFLANCHLSISWMPLLEKIVENLANDKPHTDFRLWLSSAPHPNFPISILQNGIKMTTEPPKGIKPNLTRLYSTITEQTFRKTTKPGTYTRLLFSLCFFHALLLERKKFLTLGWNTACDFNDSDFEICENVLTVLLDEYAEIPWEALKYLIAEANYGGRVTDEWDRRVLRSYINQLFCADAITVPQYNFCAVPTALTTYYMPEGDDLENFREYIAQLPVTDNPLIFGQHSNADIASQIRESGNMLATLFSLQPQVTTGIDGGLSREDQTAQVCADILRKLPEDIDFAGAFKLASSDMLNPMNVVLLQEIGRYNFLLGTIRKSLEDLQKGLKGIVLMTPDLEAVYSAITEARVPALWGKSYASLKPLASWIRDLSQRIEHFNEWALGNEPKLFWIGAFTFPTGFLTAVLQKAARKNSIPVDALGWEFNVIPAEEDIRDGSKEGVYIKNLYLEGASWDKKNNTLKESRPMELVVQLPIIQFKPVEVKKKGGKGVYTCPLYYYPYRSGTRERPSFIIAMELKSGAYEADFYIQRGTAALASLP